MKNKKKTLLQSKAVEADFDAKYSKYYWLIIPVLTIIYFAFSYFSNGFYQDDEVAHYINMRDFWSDPWIIMSNWGKPGWKIFLVIPALAGFKATLLVHALITALTAYFTILLAKTLKFRNAIIAGILFAFQPLVLQLSFRNYAEIFTGLLLVLTLYFYYKENYILSALLCGLSFTARQEAALLAVVLAIFFIIEKKYLPVLFLGVFPLLLNLLGYLHTGDILWAWTQMQGLGELNMGVNRSFFHYFGVFIYITGPIAFALFILGLFAPYVNKEKFKTFYKKESLIYIFFFIVFLFQCYLVEKGTNPGSWRYILQVSPFVSLIALIGFNQLSEKNIKNFVIGTLIAVNLVILVFFSKEGTGLVISDTTEFSKLMVTLLFTAGAFYYVISAKVSKVHQLVIFTAIVTIGYTFISEKPKQQTPENIAVNNIADWYKQNKNNSPEVLYNHSLVLFYGDITGPEKQNFKILNMKSLEEAPKGSLVLWDSHYSFRPEYKNDTKLEFLQNNPNYKLLNQISSADRRFAAFIFEKL
ncbi:MAG: hypothetical protein EHM58_17220 [Ignavibacteriae bacterium]|nr:MAG: hypothetical protein EHM58_17220 [Ignavibacteriota bacterium]